MPPSAAPARARQHPCRSLPFAMSWTRRFHRRRPRCRERAARQQIWGQRTTLEMSPPPSTVASRALPSHGPTAAPRTVASRASEGGRTTAPPNRWRLPSQERERERGRWTEQNEKTDISRVQWLLANRMWIDHDGSHAKPSLNTINKDDFVKIDVLHFILMMILPPYFLRRQFFENCCQCSIVKYYYSSSESTSLYCIQVTNCRKSIIFELLLPLPQS